MGGRSQSTPLFSLTMFALLLNASFLGSPAMAESDPSPYLIGPTDILNIYVWKPGRRGATPPPEARDDRL